LLLTPPTVVDPIAPELLRPKASDVRFERVSFEHAGGQPLFSGLDLAAGADIRRAAQAAHVTEFADDLPDGFGTMVGERGVKLSG